MFSRYQEKNQTATGCLLVSSANIHKTVSNKECFQNKGRFTIGSAASPTILNNACVWWPIAAKEIKVITIKNNKKDLL